MYPSHVWQRKREHDSTQALSGQTAYVWILPLLLSSCWQVRFCLKCIMTCFSVLWTTENAAYGLLSLPTIIGSPCVVRGSTQLGHTREDPELLSRPCSPHPMRPGCEAFMILVQNQLSLLKSSGLHWVLLPWEDEGAAGWALQGTVRAYWGSGSGVWAPGRCRGSPTPASIMHKTKQK